jgi:type II secretion system (T2SS) protein K
VKSSLVPVDRDSPIRRGGSSGATRANPPRRGMALALVLLVVLLLAYAGYSFTALMVTEAATTSMYERDAQTRACADSGIEYVAAILGEAVDGAALPNLYNNPELFQALLLQDAPVPRGRLMLSIVAPVENDVSGSTIRFGLVDQSSKLNVNALLQTDLDDDQLRDALLALPNMTIEIADAILDWIDDDDQPRMYGAENEYYGTLTPPYETKNGPLESLDELLLVRGVTAQLLFGEDVNRNGLLDANENDGELTAPLDIPDGALDRGWHALLTTASREANLRSDGTPRINVNQDDLVALYDELLAEFDEETALFVTAMRIGSATGDDAEGASGANDSGAGGSGRGGGGAAESSGPGATQEPASQTGGGGSGTSVARGGLDLSSGGQTQINSLYELVGATLSAEVNDQTVELASPWPDDPSSLAESLPILLDTLATTDEEFVEGRVNIAQAPREVLLAIPDIDEELVNAILGAQVAMGVAAAESDPLRATSAWLLVEGHVDLETMRSLDPFVGGNGDLVRVQVLAQFEAGGPATRLEATIDATGQPPRVVSVRDLTSLGWGYSASQISQPAGTF